MNCHKMFCRCFATYCEQKTNTTSRVYTSANMDLAWFGFPFCRDMCLRLSIRLGDPVIERGRPSFLQKGRARLAEGKGVLEIIPCSVQVWCVRCWCCSRLKKCIKTERPRDLYDPFWFHGLVSLPLGVLPSEGMAMEERRRGAWEESDELKIKSNIMQLLFGLVGLDVDSSFSRLVDIYVPILHINTNQGSGVLETTWTSTIALYGLLIRTP